MAYRGTTPINTHREARYRAKLDAAIGRSLDDATLVALRTEVARGYALALKSALARGDALTTDDMRRSDDGIVVGVRRVTAAVTQAQTDPVDALRLAHAIVAATRLALWDTVERARVKLGERFDGALHAPPYWMAQGIAENAGVPALRHSLMLAGKALDPGADSRKAWQHFTKAMDRASSVRTRFIHMASDEDLRACLEGLRVPERWRAPVHVGRYRGNTRRTIALWARVEKDDPRVQTLQRMLRGGAITQGRVLRRVAHRLGIERTLRELLEAK